jgi:hypothetical protein
MRLSSLDISDHFWLRFEGENLAGRADRSRQPEAVDALVGADINDRRSLQIEEHQRLQGKLFGVEAVTQTPDQKMSVFNIHQVQPLGGAYPSWLSFSILFAAAAQHRERISENWRSTSCRRANKDSSDNFGVSMKPDRVERMLSNNISDKRQGLSAMGRSSTEPAAGSWGLSDRSQPIGQHEQTPSQNILIYRNSACSVGQNSGS